MEENGYSFTNLAITTKDGTTYECTSILPHTGFIPIYISMSRDKQDTFIKDYINNTEVLNDDNHFGIHLTYKSDISFKQKDMNELLAFNLIIKDDVIITDDYTKFINGIDKHTLDMLWYDTNILEDIISGYISLKNIPMFNTVIDKSNIENKIDGMSIVRHD